MEDHAPDALPPEVFVPPELTDGESFHVFVIYSSSDLLWTQALIQELEDRGLRVCVHDRDFTPGRFILENMSDCIQQSQKVLLVLSQDFVRSHWCLLEVNMSLFRDSLQRTLIVPVLLQKDLSIPLYLSHLTYLEASRPDFSEQLLRVLCLPNHQLQNSAVVKVIIPADEDVHSESDCGVWSIEIPQQLHLIIQEPDRYKKAIKFINRVSQEKATPFNITNKVYLNLHLNFSLLTFMTLIVLFLIILNVILFSKPTSLPPASNHKPSMPCSVGAFPSGSSLVSVSKIIGELQTAVGETFTLYKDKITMFLGFIILVFMCVFVHFKHYLNNKPTCVLEELKKASGEANALLCQDNLLMGALNTSEMCLVCVSLDACKQELIEQFPENHDLFHKALLKISSDYASLLFKNNFPFETPNDTGHLNESVCFCQYVLHELDSVK